MQRQVRLADFAVNFSNYFWPVATDVMSESVNKWYRACCVSARRNPSAASEEYARNERTRETPSALGAWRHLGILLRLSQELAPILRGSRRARIVNVSSGIAAISDMQAVMRSTTLPMQRSM